MSKIEFSAVPSLPYTSNGITWSSPAAHQFSAQGTATANSLLYLHRGATLPSWLVYDHECYLNLDTSGSNIVFYLELRKASNNTWTTIVYTTSSRSFTIPSVSGGYNYCNIVLRVSSGHTVNQTIYPYVYTNPYHPQLSEYSPDNVWTSPFYQGALGGYYAMPNCTRYCYGRWRSLLGYWPSGLANLGDAEQWWGSVTAYAKGSTPKLGAIICFRDGPYSGLGHVAVVEKIYDDGCVIFSNSAYRGDMWYKKSGTAAHQYHDGGHGEPGYEAGYVFQGFIYPPVDFDGPGDNTPDPGPGPPGPGYRMNPLLRYMAKKQIYKKQGRGFYLNFFD